jgi:TRAP-type mannitol/chloroaromatic compound transport system permease small subunit
MQRRGAGQPMEQIVVDRTAGHSGARSLAAIDLLLRFSESLRRLLELVASASGWLLVVMAAVTCFDVLARKTGLPVPLTKLQELEWHFHAAVFSLWMGYGYTINAHPRVDSFTETLSLRRKAWIELAGCVLLALPYVALVAYHSIGFVVASYAVHEQSTSSVGLTHRWIIKGIYAAGLWLVVLGILSVLARVIVVLFGGRSQAEVNLPIGPTTLDV